MGIEKIVNEGGHEKKRLRWDVEIVANILEECKPGLSKTHISAKTHINYNSLDKYLIPLLQKETNDQGLLRIEGNLHITTARGLGYLEVYSGLEKTFVKLEQNLAELEKNREEILTHLKLNRKALQMFYTKK